jgi:hypothetical protein
MTQPFHQTYSAAFRHGRYYQHSGQINAAGLLAALAVGSIAGLVLGAIYAAAVVFIPFVKLRFLICLLYGICLGVVPARVLQFLKVRNIPISLVIVGIVTLISYYFSWACWEKIVARNIEDFPSLVQIATHPRLVYDLAVLFDDGGTWSLGDGSEAMKGNALLAIWGIEAITVFAGSVLVARSALASKPFCEKCEQWCAGPKTLRITTPVDDATLRSKLELGDLAYVASLGPPRSGQSLEFHLHRCDTCKQMVTLSVVKKSVTLDKKGRAKANKTKTVINKLLVQEQDLQKMMPATPPINAGQKI